MLAIGHKSTIFYESIPDQDNENYWKFEEQTEDCCGGSVAKIILLPF